MPLRCAADGGPLRRTVYLFLRPGSRNWHVKPQSPSKRVERSLGTPDRAQAEILALPMIAEHKVKLLEARPRLETTWQHEYEPGRPVCPNFGGLHSEPVSPHHAVNSASTMRRARSEAQRPWRRSFDPLVSAQPALGSSATR
jgi:hypothetical protein